ADSDSEVADMTRANVKATVIAAMQDELSKHGQVVRSDIAKRADVHLVQTQSASQPVRAARNRRDQVSRIAREWKDDDGNRMVLNVKRVQATLDLPGFPTDPVVIDVDLLREEVLADPALRLYLWDRQYHNELNEFLNIGYEPDVVAQARYLMQGHYWAM